MTTDPRTRIAGILTERDKRRSRHLFRRDTSAAADKWAVDTIAGVMDTRISELEAQLTAVREHRDSALKRADAEIERLKSGLRLAISERDDYAARLKASDRSWRRLAAERDQARTDADRLTAQLAAAEDTTSAPQRARTPRKPTTRAAGSRGKGRSAAARTERSGDAEGV